MKIVVQARFWGSPAGGNNGMAQATSYLVETLGKFGHEVCPTMDQVKDFAADLIITTDHPRWRRTAAAAIAAGATDRLVYWHHAGGVPDGHGCILAAPPSIEPQAGWGRQVVLPPSSWAAEQGGECTGDEILVAGAGPAKGGHVALEVARLCRNLKWFVLPSRSSAEDRAAWRDIPDATMAAGVLPPDAILSRARAVLSPTRFEVHPLLLVEAAARGIPIVCTDLPATRCAVQDSAIYVPIDAPAVDWIYALVCALAGKLPRLRLRPYAEVVSEALGHLVERRAAA